jgi:hypothetical protein
VAARGEQVTYASAQRTFSHRTVNTFVNYFLDELETVVDYYNNKAKVAANPEKLWIDNYHGKVVNGKMDHTGNGGRFRYFGTLTIGNNTEHINQNLAYLERYGSTEDVMNYLKALKSQLLLQDNPSQPVKLRGSEPIYLSMNQYLFDSTRREMDKLVNMGLLGIRNGRYYNRQLPEYLLNEYDKAKVDDRALVEEDILYSILGSFVANQNISIIELEKCVTGDPAFYKWSKQQQAITRFDEQLQQEVETGEFNEVITENDVDKTKRLGSALSTGTNLRVDGDPSYTVL